MGFDTIIRGKIALASDLLDSLQPKITFYAWTGQTGKGVETFAVGVSYRALVDRNVKQYYTRSGKLVQTVAKVTFLDPIANTTATGRTNPIDPRDKIVLDDGTTAPIVDVHAFEDAGLKRPFLSEVTLGKVMS